VNLTDFGDRVVAGLNAISDAVEEVDPERKQSLPQDFRELLSVARAAASQIILAASLDEAINRLKLDQLGLAAVAQVAILARTDAETERVINLAYASSSQDTPDLPCFALGSFLTELCNGLEPGKRPE
jgi:hypothetical protein